MITVRTRITQTTIYPAVKMIASDFGNCEKKLMQIL